VERVAFLIEGTGERLGCMLNPESVVVRRAAGVRPRRSSGGSITGAGLSDDPLLYTGGGTTEIQLDLLFDVTLPGSTVQAEDVRQLTVPLWNLAENGAARDGDGRPPQVRFIWGKTWNIPGVVAAVAERLEYFTPDGTPRRSWIRLRLLRTAEPEVSPEPAEVPMEGLADPAVEEAGAPEPEVSDDEVRLHEVRGGEDTGGGERLDTIAHQYYGSSRLWRLIASFNGIADPACLISGLILKIPSLESLRRRFV